MRKVLLFASVLGGCNASGELPSSVQVLFGHESDAFASPAPTHVELALVSGTTRQVLTDDPAPATSLGFDWSTLPAGAIAQFEVTGVDASGTVRARGASVAFDLDAAVGVDVPVFVGRASAFSRPPDVLQHPHQRPIVLVAVHQFLVAAGGDALPGVDPSVPDFYDVAGWSTLTSQPPLPRAPKSAAAMLAALFLMDDTGATWLNLTNEATSVVVPPSGLTFAEIAGASAVTMTDGTVYFVGATRRAGEPTAKVLQINTKGDLAAVSLSTPRLGAAAAEVGGRLVVAGGSATGPGVEFLDAQGTTFVTTAAPPDGIVGAALLPLDKDQALLLGGEDPSTAMGAPVRKIGVTCTTSCEPVVLGPLPVALSNASAFALGASEALLTGDGDDGETHVLRVATDATSAVEVQLRERRKGASAVLMPNGEVALVGGVSVDATATPTQTLEMFAP